MYVAIKSMKNMPNKCVECGLKSGGYCYHKNPPYNLSESDLLEEKPNDCPLVEIVTCKDCKNWVKGVITGVTDDKEWNYCPMMDCNTADDFFCAETKKERINGRVY